MKQLPDIIELGAEDEARRLWLAAAAARTRAAFDIGALLEALNLGIRTVEILVVSRLYDARDEFPATITARLGKPSPEIDVLRDTTHVPDSLGFSEIIDLLAQDDAPCVAPGMHRGWEDRRFACRRSRTTARTALGYTIPPEDYDNLLLLAACRNRVFRLPPPVRLPAAELLAAFASLERMADAVLG